MREKAGAIVADLGGDVSTIRADLIGDYCRADLLIETVSAHIEQRGAFTQGGKRRPAVDLLLSLIDRRLKLAITLGIERRSRDLTALSAAEYAALQERARDRE